MRRITTAFVFALVLAIAANPSGAANRSVKLGHLPPRPKDVIAAVFSLSDVPLTDATCKGYGTEPTDKTIGAYLSGYLAELSDQKAQNAITTTVETQSVKGTQVFVCTLMVRHAQGEDVWSWGVRFTANKTTGVVLSGSVQCIGAG